MNIFKTANLLCRGAGDSHLPRSLRARSPHVLSHSGGGFTAYGRGTKFREPPEQCTTSAIPPELSNLMNQVLAIERIGPLRRGRFRLRRPACAAGLRQMQSTCTKISYKDGKLGLPGCRWLSPAAEHEGAQPSCPFPLRRRFHR